jgi:predicted SpoU family rRNA methylase
LETNSKNVEIPALREGHRLSRDVKVKMHVKVIAEGRNLVDDVADVAHVTDVALAPRPASLPMTQLEI